MRAVKARRCKLPTLILASASPTRATLLGRAGIEVAVDPAAIDEGAIRQAARAEGLSTENCAILLAEMKALQVSQRHPGTLVLGADQMLDCRDAWFEKPESFDDLRRDLARLSGHSHRLVSAAAIARDGERLWHTHDAARLRMRRLDAGLIEAYLRNAGREVMGSVGGYQVEGLGIQLFDSIEGDHATILGLPLLPLLAYLREHGIGLL